MSPSSSARTAPKLFWACSRTSTGSECGVVTGWSGDAEEAPRDAAPLLSRSIS